ncbi:undecaprenyl-phosphate glucose phosphotransferase [Acidobacteriota bacterium]
MIRRSDRALVPFLICTDIVVSVLTWLAAYEVRFNIGIIPAPHGIPSISSYLLVLPFMAILWPLTLWAAGAYTQKRGMPKIDEAYALGKGVLVAAVLLFGADAFIRMYTQRNFAEAFQFSRLALLLFVPLNFLALTGARLLIRRNIEKAYRQGYSTRKALIAGAGDLGCRLADKILDHAELGYEIVGFVDDQKFTDSFEFRDLTVLGCLDDIVPLIEKHKVRELFIALPFDQYGKAFQVITPALRECVDIRIVPDLMQYFILRASVDDLDGMPLINLNESPQLGLGFLAKRIFDTAIATGALVLFSPVLLAITAAIKLSSRGPVLFKQERMGLDGRSFIMYKFRTMKIDAEKETGPVWSKPGDPRRTRLGAFLRRTSLDEFMQFFNVLKGEMSVVGPRPERPEFLKEFKEKFPEYMLRHKVKSGITGWAQVHGWRGNTSLQKRIEHDLYYIQNWSLWLDVKIILRTFIHGFAQRNAY